MFNKPEGFIMAANTSQSLAIAGAASLALLQKYPPLSAVTNPNVPTEQAGLYLDRRPQTLRIWALTGHPLTPLRINGRLAWPVAGIKKLLGVTA